MSDTGNATDVNDQDRPVSGTLQCWDCGNDEFRIYRKNTGSVAECLRCGGYCSVTSLYVSDENGREYYDMEMKDD